MTKSIYLPNLIVAVLGLAFIAYIVGVYVGTMCA